MDHTSPRLAAASLTPISALLAAPNTTSVPHITERPSPGVDSTGLCRAPAYQYRTLRSVVHWTHPSVSAQDSERTGRYAAKSNTKTKCFPVKVASSWFLVIDFGGLGTHGLAPATLFSPSTNPYQHNPMSVPDIASYVGPEHTLGEFWAYHSDRIGRKDHTLTLVHPSPTLEPRPDSFAALVARYAMYQYRTYGTSDA